MMEPSKYWHDNEAVSIKEAVLLIIGIEPQKYAEINIPSSTHRYPKHYFALEKALINAVLSKKIQNVSDEEHDMPSIGHWTAISTHSLKAWLKDKGLKNNFFFHTKRSLPLYLDPSHPYYSNELAAAVQAWEAVTKTIEQSVGSTPKQLSQKWLKETMGDKAFIIVAKT